MDAAPEAPQLIWSARSLALALGAPHASTMGLDLVEMVMELEKEFQLDMPDDDLRALRTVGDFYLYLEHRLANAGRVLSTGRCEGDLWNRYLEIVERETGVPRGRLLPEAEFYRDLGVG